MNIAAIIVGIDGWEQYTSPLIRSLFEHEPTCAVTVVDNESVEPYDDLEDEFYANLSVARTERLCYSAAINYGKAAFRHDELWRPDWYIVLSNDVLCTGPFARMLEQQDGEAVIGPLVKEIAIEGVGTVPYVEGWCVACPRKIWDRLGGWDEGMQISSYEDCDFSHRARKEGFWLEQVELPFVHLDQKQRFYLVPDYWNSEHHNRARFIEKHAQAVTA